MDFSRSTLNGEPVLTGSRRARTTMFRAQRQTREHLGRLDSLSTPASVLDWRELSVVLHCGDATPGPGSVGLAPPASRPAKVGLQARTTGNRSRLEQPCTRKRCANPTQRSLGLILCCSVVALPIPRPFHLSVRSSCRFELQPSSLPGCPSPRRGWNCRR